MHTYHDGWEESGSSSIVSKVGCSFADCRVTFDTFSLCGCRRVRAWCVHGHMCEVCECVSRVCLLAVVASLKGVSKSIDLLALPTVRLPGRPVCSIQVPSSSVSHPPRTGPTTQSLPII
eukprot:GHVU01226310.1.p2 GENE.GHVU01226310.1~~GHVU01226310.1.p2  ORF type:complete len:119 (-),score=2.38 GHVU01226310.1:377-733(-)